MEPFVERMVKEYYDLKEKTVKLGKFISTCTCNLTDDEISDLDEQYSAMRVYMHILARRLKRQGYDVTDCCDTDENG